MKKTLLILSVLFALNLSARTPLITWQCDELTVSFYANDKMLVGGLLYDVSFQGGHIVLYAGNRAMLMVSSGQGGGIIITNTDDTNDRKYFTKCK